MKKRFAVISATVIGSLMIGSTPAVAQPINPDQIISQYQSEIQSQIDRAHNDFNSASGQLIAQIENSIAELYRVVSPILIEIGVPGIYLDQIIDQLYAAIPGGQNSYTSPQVVQPSAVVTNPAPAPVVQYSATDRAVDYVKSQLGTPYMWGGTGNGGFDCSGLMQAAYNAAGISLPRTTHQQINSGYHVSLSQAQPGDLVFYYNTGHVGMYVGGGQIIHAPTSGSVVSYASVHMAPVEAVVRVS